MMDMSEIKVAELVRSMERACNSENSVDLDELADRLVGEDEPDSDSSKAKKPEKEAGTRRICPACDKAVSNMKYHRWKMHTPTRVVEEPPLDSIMGDLMGPSGQ